jgi:hypothetical protein
MNTPLTAADYRKVAAIQEKIDALEKDKAKLLGVAPKRFIPPETRKKMSESQQKRRAKDKKGKGGKTKAKGNKPKRVVTEATRAKIAAGQKARWATKKSAK